MPRSGWGLIAAIGIGLAVIAYGAGILVGSGSGGGYSEDQQAVSGYASPGKEGQHPQRAEFRRGGIPDSVERAISNPQAEDGAEREQRDLAAQESMATFAWWVVVVGSVQTLVAGFALAALLSDLRQNRLSAERQLRAYVTVEHKGVLQETENTGAAALLIKNAGQTPAYQIKVCSGISVSADPLHFDASEEEFELVAGESDLTMGPGDAVHVYTRFWALTDDDQALVRDKEAALMHFGTVTYEDAFGASRVTEFCAYYQGEELSPDAARRARRGNRAT